MAAEFSFSPSRNLGRAEPPANPGRFSLGMQVVLLTIIVLALGCADWSRTPLGPDEQGEVAETLNPDPEAGGGGPAKHEPTTQLCLDALGKLLRSPSTLQIVEIFSDQTFHQDKITYDAENAFGTPVRGSIICQYKSTEGTVSPLELVDVTISGEKLSEVDLVLLRTDLVIHGAERLSVENQRLLAKHGQAPTKNGSPLGQTGAHRKDP